MIKYKIVHSTIDYLRNLELEYDFSKYIIGDNISMFGMDMRINQTGGGIIGLSNSKNILVFQEIINNSDN